MNRELLLRVADHIDNFPDSFELSWWAQPARELAGHEHDVCDTVGCVAGWAVMVMDPTIRLAVVTGNLSEEAFDFETEARAFLELDIDQATILFTSNRWWGAQMKRFGIEPREGFDEWNEDYVALDAVPPKAASTILRALAEGEITLGGDWASDF